MIKLTSLLDESAEQMYSSINKAQCEDIIETHCIKIFRKRNDYPIFRGIHTSEDYLYVDTTKSKRVSAFAEGNFYTLIMDKVFPKYGYPNRSNSVVCTTNYDTADGYGDHVYCVFPFDNTKIGICSERDIWISFENSLGNYITLEEFNSGILAVISQLRLDKVTGVPKSFQSLKSLETLFNIIKLNKNKEYIRTNSVIRLLIDKSFNEILEMFNPNKNGFTLQYAKDFNMQLDREVWFNGKGILVRKDIFDDEHIIVVK